MRFNSLVHRYINEKPRLRQTLTRLLEGSGETTVSLMGVELTIDKVREHGYLRSSRMANLSSLFGDEVSVLLTLSGLIPHIDTLVDAGANIGIYSAVLGRLKAIYPSLRCVAFEADPTTFARLRRNLAGPHFSCHNVALSDTAGNLRFIRGAVSHVTSVVDHATAYSLGNHFDIPCQRLDSFEVPGERLLIKVDVEGHEYPVLQGASRWFEERRCVAVYLDGCKRGNEIQQFLRHHDFEFVDGRTLETGTAATFSLLALRKDWLTAIRRANFHDSQVLGARTLSQNRGSYFGRHSSLP